MLNLQAYKKTIANRAFESNVASAHKAGRIYIPIYLSIGTEHIAAILSELCPDFQVFAQHRCHSYYLSYGGNPSQLRDELLGLDSGCNKGRGGSASISIPGKMYGHSGLLGDQVPIAVGAAHASGRDTLCVFGDAACEEDYVLGALGYAVTKKAPVLFICEDNDLSILTEKKVRRSWSIVDVARGFGMPSIDICDEPEIIERYVTKMKDKLPALININTHRDVWHCGSGVDGSELGILESYTKQIFEQYGKTIRDGLDIIKSMDELWRL